MKRALLRCLIYALAGLALVSAYVELHSYGRVQVTLRDESGFVGGSGFNATRCGSTSDTVTMVRDGHVLCYAISYKTVVENGKLGIAVNYHGTRDGKVSEYRGVLPFTSGSQWTHLDDHLLASASLQ